jgi:DNA-binding MarR family transcriptional regulator
MPSGTRERRTAHALPVGRGRPVDRHVNPTSRREVLLDLTEAGDQTVNRATQLRRRQIARIVARMPERCRTQLVESLDAVNQAGKNSRPSP